MAAKLTEVGTIEVPKAPPYEKEDDAFKQSRNMSGLLCPEPDWCLMVADEKRGFHRLKVTRAADGTPSISHDAVLDLGEPSKQFAEAHGLKGKLKEYDLEAVASIGGKVYFVGSHARKRKSGKYNAGAHLVAVASLADLKSGTQIKAEWACLDKLFQADDVLSKAWDRQLQCGGLNVEGATIFGDELLIGVRSPTQGTDGGNPGCFVVATPVAGLLAEDFSKARRIVLPLEKPFIGIRAMATDKDRVMLIIGDAGVSDLVVDDDDEEEPHCTTNENPEDLARRFQLRVWKPAKGDALEPEVLEFDPVDEIDAEGKSARAKLEAIAVDSARPGAFFILFDGSATVRYLKDIETP